MKMTNKKEGELSDRKKIFIRRKNVVCSGFVFFLSEMGYADTINYGEQENWDYLGIGREKAVDLFLIAPTVSGGNQDKCNILLDDQSVEDKFLGALNMERGIYEPTCRMYAPYYRQVTAYAYAMPESIAKQYFELAYQDIRTSFFYYLKSTMQADPLFWLVLARAHRWLYV